MREKKTVLIGMILVFGIILSLNSINSYATSNVQFTQYQPSSDLFGIQSSLEFDESMCQEGQDFLIQIAPFGCIPAVVRSDLLEEQNVPVFCQLAATKINPLIDVEAIESLSFIGEYPPEVAGIGFEPVKSALGGERTLNRPTILNNIGYAVIVLKKQPSEAEMPDYVEGTLGIKIKYDIKNAFGIGRANFYLPVLTDAEWEEKKNQYGFWDGKGFLRVEGIEGDKAKITLYDDTKKIKSVVLSKGETSKKIYLPGFYCLSSLELKLHEVKAPETRTRLRINNDYVEVGEGEKFLDDRCSVIDLYEAGILDRVTISCKEDEGGGLFGTSTHILSIVPKLKLSISPNGEKKEYGIGDLLYTYTEGEGANAEVHAVYLAYANTKGNTGREEDLEIGIISVPQGSRNLIEEEEDKLDEGTINYVGRLARAYEWESKKGKANIGSIMREVGQFFTGVAANLATRILTGKAVTFISNDGTITVLGKEIKESVLETKTYGNRKISIIGFSEPVDINLDIATQDMTQARKYYDLADKDFKSVINNYPLEKETESKEVYGEKALRDLISLNRDLKQKRKVVSLCEEFEEEYKESILPGDCKGIVISNSDIDSTLVTINGRTSRITLDSIYEPDLSEYSAEVLVKGPSGKSEVITLGKGRTVYLDDFRGRPDEIFNLGSEISNIDFITLGTAQLFKNNLYVRYEKDRWEWNYCGSGWKSVSENLNETYTSTGAPLFSSRQVNLLYSLRNKDFDEGNRIVLIETGYAGESIELFDLEQEYAKLRISVWGKGITKRAIDFLVSDSHTLELGKPQNFGSEYVFTLSKVNLKEDAVVSVIPGIDSVGSQANFSFKVGIEKRGIKLSPGKIKSMINNLDDTIEKWNETSAKLGKVVKGLKTACLVGGVALTVKNFFANIGGKGIARQSVMRGEGGWHDICVGKVEDKTYSSLDECYHEFSSEIEKDVEYIYKLQQQQQEKIKVLEKESSAIQEGGFLGEDTLDDNKYMGVAIEEFKKDLVDSKGEIRIPDPKNPGQTVDVSGMINYKIYSEQGTFTPEDIRAIHFNKKIMESDASQKMKDATEKRYNSLLGKVYSASKEYESASILAESKGILISDITTLQRKDLKAYIYAGKTGKDFGLDMWKDSPIQLVHDPQTNKNYYVVLEKDDITGQYGIERWDLHPEEMIVLDLNGEPIEDPNKIVGLNRTIFKKADESTYKNKGFKNPTIHFYETAPYKGMPAIVPINTKDGWYAATKQTLPVFGGISSFDKSGRVTSFYLCHVGSNGLQEFRSGIGDDICQMINLGTGMAYNQFPGLSKSEAEKYIRCGVQAIEQASRAHKSGGIIKIKTSCGSVSSKVGSPAIDIPNIQCQDFMSPIDCKILYNLCDPVICPSSRCDLGGVYPVKDVIQTGIIGGLILCLPNIKEGVYIPVCLTGIQAGIDGLVSVFTAHRDCLQEQLDTGKTVGICDEIQSIYMCELLWRQMLPFAEVAIPKLIGALTGTGRVRGGGEYLGVKNAWESASKSFSFFTQYYAENSFAAFKLRSTEQIGTEICRSFVSGVVPSMEIIDQFTEPDSPSQFHGRFDEIPFTTVTSPPISHYKVFYHIFAGKDSSAYYKVYLKGSSESSYYLDASASRIVAQGYIAAGDIATETKDFTAPSGYRELCINVNGQEECGFKQVTTSLAINYVRDQYIKEQASQTGIKSEKECISGSASVYSLLNPNLQEGVGEVMNPGVYNYGITRICSTENPGKGTDPSAGGESSRWVEVGYCDNTKIKCWTDTSKIDDITKFRTTEDEILSDLKDNTLKLLQKSDNGYIDDRLDTEITKVETTKRNNKEKAIQLVNELLGKVFLNKNKARLYLLRGSIYTEIAKGFFDKEVKRLEGERTSELISKKSVELREGENLTGEQILRAFNEDEQRVIQEGECERCGTGSGFCDEAECLAIGRYNNKNCVYERANKLDLWGYCKYVEIVAPTERKVEYYFESGRDLESIQQAVEYFQKNRLCDGYGELGLFTRTIREASLNFGLPDPLVLLSIISQESNCEATKTSNQGRGLMQISESDWNKYCKSYYPQLNYGELSERSKIRDNIWCGARILKAKYDEENKRLKKGIVYDCNNVRYFDWDIAIRSYDGWTCKDNVKYVQLVMARYQDMRFSQLLEKKVTVTFSGTELSEALNFLNSITKLEIDYSRLDETAYLDLSVEDEPLSSLLEKMGLTYAKNQEENKIIITRFTETDFYLK